MLPFTANEQVLYSAIPEMHSRHQCSNIYAALDCQENRSVIKAIISRSWLETLTITVLFPDKKKTFWTITFSFFLFFFSPSPFFFLSESTRCVLHIWASAIMQMMGTYLHECPWTTVLNNYEDYVQCRKNLRFKTIRIFAVATVADR